MSSTELRRSSTCGRNRSVGREVRKTENEIQSVKLPVTHSEIVGGFMEPGLRS